MQLSEQQKIILASAKPPGTEKDRYLVRVTAAAGTGKTTTLLALAEQCAKVGHSHICYVTFSKSATKDGDARMRERLAGLAVQPTLEVKTLHACAMSLLCKSRGEEQDGIDMEAKLYTDEDIQSYIQANFGPEMDRFLQVARANIMNFKKESQNSLLISAQRQVVFFIYKTLNQFCRSSESLEEFRDIHRRKRNYYPATVFHTSEDSEKRGFPMSVYQNKVSFYADTAVQVWDSLEQNQKRSYDIEMKRAHLKALRIPGSILLVDESQDMDGCQVAWIANQANHGTHVYLVGDAAQTIYGFRGAKSKFMMEILGIDYSLTKSWRFGNQIAQIANAVLFSKEFSPQTTKNQYSKLWNPYRVEGCGQEGIVTANPILPKWRDMKVTLIANTNATLLVAAMSLFDSVLGESQVKLEGDAHLQQDVLVKEEQMIKDEKPAQSSQEYMNVPVETSHVTKEETDISLVPLPTSKTGVNKHKVNILRCILAQAGMPTSGKKGALATAVWEGLQNGSITQKDYSIGVNITSFTSVPPAQVKEDPQAADTKSVIVDTVTSQNAPGIVNTAIVTESATDNSAGISLNEIRLPKIHINGQGASSGLQKWKTVLKEIGQLFELYKTAPNGMVLDRKKFHEFGGETVTWESFRKQVETRELSRYASTINVISTFGEKTMEAMDRFRTEVMDKNYPSEEADIILSTCHAAKGMEWDNVQVYSDFLDICNVKKEGPLIMKRDRNSNPSRRASWHFNFSNYGDDVNKLYVACTRSKKLLSIPPSITLFLEYCDIIHMMVHKKKMYTEVEKGKSSGVIVFGGKEPLSVQETLNLYHDLVVPLRKQNNLEHTQLLKRVLLKSLDSSKCDEEDDESVAIKDEPVEEISCSQASQAPAALPKAVAAAAKAVAAAAPKKPKPTLNHALQVLEEWKQAGATRPQDKKEKSPTSKATCRECRVFINQGDIRVGIQKYETDNSGWVQYYHLKCCDPAVVRQLKPAKQTAAPARKKSSYTKKSYYSNGGNGSYYPNRGRGKYW